MAWISAIERALPVPPPAGISAPRQARVRVSETSTPGLLKVISWISDWMMSESAPPGGGGTRSATRASSEAGRPIQKSALSGPAISSRKKVPMVLPVTLPDHLADQIALRMVAW